MKTLIAGLTICGTIAVSASAQESVNLKFASFVPERSITMAKVMVPFIEDVNAASEGTLNIEFFPGGILGRSPAQQLRLLQDGVADISFIVPSYTAGRFPDNDVFELPLLIETVAEGSYAAWRMFEAGNLRGYEDIKVLGLFAGVASLHTTFPVEDLAALSGEKIRGAGYLQSRMIEQMDAVPMSSVATEITENMSRGVYTGTLLDWNSVGVYRVPEVAQYHIDAPFGSALVLIAMNKDVYDKLPDAGKAALDKYSGEAFSKRYVDVLAPAYQKARETVAAGEGQTVRTLTEDERANLNEAFAPIIADWQKENPNGKERFDALTETLEGIRAEGLSGL